MMQAFAYHHLVPAAEWRVAVVGQFMPKTALAVMTKTPIKIPAGGTARIEVGGPARAMAQQLRMELSDPPEGISIKSFGPSADGLEIVFQSDAAKVKPGGKGNLIVSAFNTAARRPGQEGGRRPTGHAHGHAPGDCV